MTWLRSVKGEKWFKGPINIKERGEICHLAAKEQQSEVMFEDVEPNDIPAALTKRGLRRGLI